MNRFYIFCIGALMSCVTLAWAGDEHTDPLIDVVSVELEAPGDAALKLNVHVLEAESPAELAIANEWAEREMHEATSTGAPQGVDSVVMVDGKKVSSLERWIQTSPVVARHYRRTLTFVRGALVTGTVFAGVFLNQDIPVWKALAIGVLSGSLSAAIQYNNALFQNFVTGGGSVGGQVGRWYGIQVAYMAAVMAANSALGIDSGSSTSIWGTAAATVLTSLFGLWSQGSWDMSIATRHKINDALEPSRAGFHRVITDLKSLGLSAVATGIAIADMVGFSGGKITMAVMGAAGVVAYIRTRARWKKLPASGPTVRDSRCQDALDLSMFSIVEFSTAIV